MIVMVNETPAAMVKRIVVEVEAVAMTDRIVAAPAEVVEEAVVGENVAKGWHVVVTGVNMSVPRVKCIITIAKQRSHSGRSQRNGWTRNEI